jgi:protein TonB
MFQSVLDQQEWRARRLGAGAGVSLFVHAGLIASAMVLSAGVAQQVEKEPPVVVFRRPPPRGTPIPPTTQAVAEPPKPRTTKTQKLVQHPTIPTKPLPEVTPPPETQTPPNDLPYNPIGRPDGDPDSTPCEKCEIDPNAPVTPVEPPPEEVLPFVSGNMTAPQLLSGAPIEYTREALATGVSGLLIARCVITWDGSVESCRVLKGQPHMNEAVLSALETRRYTPVEYQGRPISVIYNFHVKLSLPR